jgi:O-antigen biosynthesis protein
VKYIQFNHHPYEIHQMVYDLIKPDTKVLDLGCATGYFAKELKRKKCRVTGIDNNSDALKEAKKYCEKIINCNLDDPVNNLIPAEKFDYILLLDLIEHLPRFNRLLVLIKKYLARNGKIIITTPNIAHLSIRLKLLNGNFDYTEFGILDNTHVHFFTRKSLTACLESNGFKINSLITPADFGQIPFFGKWLRHIPKTIQWQITRILPNLLGVQWLAVVSL